MAELNFGLLTPPGSQSVGNAFVTGMDQATVARAQENQNALAQYTLSKAKREDELTNQLLGDLRSATTNDEIYRAYQRAGKGDVASKLRGEALTQTKTQGEIALQPTTLAAAKSKLLDDKLKQSRSFLATVDPADPNAPAQYIAWHKANHADPILGPALAAGGVTEAQAFAQIQDAISRGPDAFAKLVNQSKFSVEKFAELSKPTTQIVNQGGQKTAIQTTPLDGRPVPVGVFPDVPLPADVAAQKIANTIAGRTPAAPRPEQPPVAVEDPVTGKVVYVTREEALRNRMTPANTLEKPMTEGQRLKFNKDKVSDKDVVTGATVVANELEKLTDKLVGNPDKKIAPAPGLSRITGFNALTNAIALPSGDARKALQQLETFKGKIMALGRQLATQYGKLGPMAVQEWKFVSDAVEKIDPAAGNLDVQMRDVVRQAREYENRQKDRYDENYGSETLPPGKLEDPLKIR